MAGRWLSKTEAKRLSANLAASEERDFERLALPLIRVIWPEAIPPPARKAWDQQGVDQLVWSDTPPFSLIVQYKGFHVSDAELGRHQIAQCRASIAAFRATGKRAETYLLIHNRTGQNRIFREAVEAELQTLTASGQVGQAQLWDRQRFVNEAFDAMARFLAQALRTANLGVTDVFADLEPLRCAPLEAVPLRVGELHVDQHRGRQLPSFTAAYLGDPVQELTDSDSESAGLSLLVGEFGYGKTTAALRALREREQALYVPAARLNHATVGSRFLLSQFIDTDSLLEPFPEKEREALAGIASTVLERILEDPTTPVLLILDGLDESPLANQKGGLLTLFNCLRGVKVPVILTARTEYWYARWEEFQEIRTAPVHTGRATHAYRRHRVIELLPWEDAQISQLVRRFQSSLSDSQESERLDTLVQVIEHGEYEPYYGDVPRRPLFLRFILDSVAQNGVRKVGRARLFDEWVERKVTRDIRHPAALGSSRTPIAGSEESIGTTLELAYDAMERAAAAMFAWDEGQMLPTCTVASILRGADPRLAAVIEPTGLFLNSLLLPVSPRSSPGVSLSVRFAHRAFQEFFLARFVIRHPDAIPGGVELPQAVRKWVRDILDEGVLHPVVGQERQVRALTDRPDYLPCVLSHADADRDFIKQLVTDLAAFGVPCQQQRHDIGQQANPTIREPALFLLMASKGSLQRLRDVNPILAALGRPRFAHRESFYLLRLDAFLESDIMFECERENIEGGAWPRAWVREACARPVFDFRRWRKRSDTYQREFYRLLHALERTDQ
jgi:hypothetical protein